MWLWPTRLIAVRFLICAQTGSCSTLSSWAVSTTTWRPLCAITMRQVPACLATSVATHVASAAMFSSSEE